MGASNSRGHWQRKVAPLAFSILLGGVILYVFTSGPSREERDRESVCKNWGYSDEGSLARCRKSQADVNAVIAPKLRSARLKTIAEFNQDLKSGEDHSIPNEADYVPAQLGEIVKAVGLIGLNTKSEAALEGHKVKIVGRIITHTPDPGEPDASKMWEPKTFNVWGPISKAKNAMPEIVRLDIESLDRNMRKFIQDHCELVRFTRCDAVIYGHVGTVEEGKPLPLRYRGVIADKIIISPIDSTASNP